MYQIIYADPPWDYKGQLQHTAPIGSATDTGGAARHYGTVTLEDLKTLNVNDIADKTECLLFMWSSNPHLPQAIDLMSAWGFNWATVAFAWDKQKVNPGWYTMSQVELCLVGKIGRIPQPRGARNVRQFISELRTAHSAKPNHVRTMIELMFPTQRKIELFARSEQPGWDVWGNEVDGIGGILNEL